MKKKTSKIVGIAAGTLAFSIIASIVISVIYNHHKEQKKVGRVEEEVEYGRKSSCVHSEEKYQSG